MASATDTMRDVAYTTVGFNALMFDRIYDVLEFDKLGERREELLDRMGTVGERFEDAFEEFMERYEDWAKEVNERLHLDKELDKARRQARKTAKDLRKRWDPRFVEFEERMPEQVAKWMAEQRKQAWATFGATPARKPAARKPAAKKAPARKPAKKTVTVAASS